MYSGKDVWGMFMKGSMSEQAKKHFNERLWSVLILSVFLICVGAYWICIGLAEWKLGGGLAMFGNGGSILLGVWNVLFGMWGLRISGKWHYTFPEHAVIVWYSEDSFIMGWFAGIVSMICAGLYFMFRAKGDFDIAFLCMLYALLSVPFAFWLFYGYRKICLLLYDDQIECRYLFRKQVFSKSDVNQIRIIERKDRRYDSIVYTGYRFLDENGKTLFTAGKDMVHVQEFMNRFPELYQKEAVIYTAVNRKKTEGW